MKDKIHKTGKRQSEEGFALIAMIGVMSVMVITAAIVVPNMVASLDTDGGALEEEKLQAIALGTETYLRANRAWPATLSSHSPGYAPLDTTNLALNDSRFPRYYAAHPTMSGFNNSAGLDESSLVDMRFLLISNLGANVSATITNSNDFDTWWVTDEALTTGLHIHRGNLAHLLHKVTLSARGAGGSYQMDGTNVNSGGATIANYTRYHLTGTPIRLDEANTYGTPELEFTLTGDLNLEYDPLCPDGDKWHVPGLTCGGEPGQFWIVTWNDTSGKSGVGGWNEDMVIAFDGPNLTFESGPTGTTAGTFRGPLIDLNVFGASYIEALHFVSQDITIGSGGNTVDLLAGDILASDIHDVTMTSENSLFVEEKDVGQDDDDLS